MSRTQSLLEAHHGCIVRYTFDNLGFKSVLKKSREKTVQKKQRRMGEKTEVGLDPLKKYGLLVDGKLLVSRHLKARKMHDLEPINSHLQPQNMSFARPYTLSLGYPWFSQLSFVALLTRL